MNKFIVCCIKFLNTINNLVFYIINTYYIILYILCTDIGFIKYSKKEFNLIIFLNILLILSVACRIFIHVFLKKQSKMCFSIMCILFLFIFFIGVIVTIGGWLTGNLIGNVLIQYVFMFFSPFLCNLLLVLVEIHCIKESKRAKNKLKYW